MRLKTASAIASTDGTDGLFRMSDCCDGVITVEVGSVIEPNVAVAVGVLRRFCAGMVGTECSDPLLRPQRGGAAGVDCEVTAGMVVVVLSQVRLRRRRGGGGGGG